MIEVLGVCFALLVTPDGVDHYINADEIYSIALSETFQSESVVAYGNSSAIWVSLTPQQVADEINRQCEGE